VSAVPSCRIRACLPGDEQALALVGQATFLEAFAGLLRGSDILEHCAHKHTAQVYRAWLQDEGVECWLVEAEAGAAAVGYLVLTPAELPLSDLDATDLEVRRVYLLHRFQGVGLGRQLMDLARERAMRRGARRLLLGVFSQNHAAIAFYRALGYVAVGTRSFQVGAMLCEDLLLALKL